MRCRPAAFCAALAAAGFLLAAAPARADLVITIDKSTQRMSVALDGAEVFNWPVSTGAPGYDTPSGEFKPFRMEKDHFSKEWDDAPMPHSIFFTMKGHAIHGSYHKSIGRPASHGCVRLEPKNAATLFGLVRQETMARTHVVLTGETPGAAPEVARRDSNGFEQNFSTDDQTASVPPAPQRRQRFVRGWREYDDGTVYYYERPRRTYAPRYVAPRRYGYGAPPRVYYYYER